MYKAIIFDFFDVIRSDPFQTWLDRHDLKKEGEFAAAAKRLDRGEIGLKEFFKEIERLSGHPAQELARIYDGTVLTDEGILKLIDGLKANYKIGLLSNAPSDYLRNLLDTHGYEDFFDKIVISAETGLIKPSAEAFRHILGELKVRASEAVFVDDSARNVKAAEEVGIKGVRYQSPQKLAADLKDLGVKV